MRVYLYHQESPKNLQHPLLVLLRLSRFLARKPLPLPDLGVSLRGTVDGIQHPARDEELSELLVAQGNVPAVLHLRQHQEREGYGNRGK